MLQNVESYDEILCGHYLSWPQRASVDFAKSSFPKQVFITEWTCCFFHLLECENRWSMQPLCRTCCFIFKLPKLCRFVNPWTVCVWVNVTSWFCNETELNTCLNAWEEEKEENKIHWSVIVWSWDLLLRRLFQADTKPNGMMIGCSISYVFSVLRIEFEMLGCNKGNMQLHRGDVAKNIEVKTHFWSNGDGGCWSKTKALWNSLHVSERVIIIPI